MVRSALSTSTTSYGTGVLKRNPRKNKIDMFIVHHAATMSLQGVKNIFSMDGGRGTSAQYIVCDNQIISAVPEEYRAWTGGGKRDGAIADGSTLDHRAITVETVNSGGANQGWPISPQSFESLARLIEDCSRRYGFPLDRNHVIGHREMLSRFRVGFATACPGGIDVDALVLRAQQIRNGGGSVTPPAPQPPAKTPEQIEEEELMSAKDEIVKALKDHIDQVLMSRIRREVRPNLYYVKTGADGTEYTPDNSPFAAVIQPASGFILPLNAPVDGKRGQVESLKTNYRIIAGDASWDGFTEKVFLNTIKDVARGAGIIDRKISEEAGTTCDIIDRKISEEAGIAWARELFAPTAPAATA